MVKVNDNYLKLPGSYSFRYRVVNAYTAAIRARRLSGWESATLRSPLRLSYRRFTMPWEERWQCRAFHGYAPDLGYGFLREAIAAGDYAGPWMQDRG